MSTCPALSLASCQHVWPYELNSLVNLPTRVSRSNWLSGSKALKDSQCSCMYNIVKHSKPSHVNSLIQASTVRRVFLYGSARPIEFMIIPLTNWMIFTYLCVTCIKLFFLFIYNIYVIKLYYKKILTIAKLWWGLFSCWSRQACSLRQMYLYLIIFYND